MQQFTTLFVKKVIISTYTSPKSLQKDFYILILTSLHIGLYDLHKTFFEILFDTYSLKIDIAYKKG